MDKPILHINNLSIGYNHPIVTDINGALSPGMFCSLIGANGKGKSTLLNTVRNTVAKFNGSITLHGIEISKYSEKDLAKNVAIVSTFNNFSPELKVIDILTFGRIPHLGLFAKLSKKDSEIIDKYISILKIQSLTNSRFIELSDGQKQKTLICRALIQETPLILLDEPTAHLDVENRIAIFKLLKEISTQEKKAIICSTHEIDNALAYSSHIWLIDKNNQFEYNETSSMNSEEVLGKLF